MAPNLSGVSSADSARMQHLCELAQSFAVDHLKPEGALIVKAFHGSGFSQIVEGLKRQFIRVVERKPKASRDKSSETFLVARGLKTVDVKTDGSVEGETDGSDSFLCQANRAFLITVRFRLILALRVVMQVESKA